MVTVSAEAPKRRLWLVFFTDGEGAERWWSRFLRPGFKHVCAASYFADVERWVYVDPTRGALVVEVWRPDEFEGRLGMLIEQSAAILRMPSSCDRDAAPASWWCVGCIKALLGFRGRALSPRGLYRQLLANGAEIVVSESDGRSVRRGEAPERGSEGHGDAPPGTGTGGAGQDSGDAETASSRDAEPEQFARDRLSVREP